MGQPGKLGWPIYVLSCKVPFSIDQALTKILEHMEAELYDTESGSSCWSTLLLKMMPLKKSREYFLSF